MLLSVIQIGNSKGIRLKKNIIEKYNIKDKIELIMKDDHLIIKPVKAPRSGWDKAFGEMHKEGGDHLLIPDVFEDEIAEE